MKAVDDGENVLECSTCNYYICYECMLRNVTRKMRISLTPSMGGRPGTVAKQVPPHDIGKDISSEELQIAVNTPKAGHNKPEVGQLFARSRAATATALTFSLDDLDFSDEFDLAFEFFDTDGINGFAAADRRTPCSAEPGGESCCTSTAAATATGGKCSHDCCSLGVPAAAGPSMARTDAEHPALPTSPKDLRQTTSRGAEAAQSQGIAEARSRAVGATNSCIGGFFQLQS